MCDVGAEGLRSLHIRSLQGCLGRSRLDRRGHRMKSTRLYLYSI